MVARVNVNIPPPLIERARIAQLANRQALESKQRQAKTRNKALQEIAKKTAADLPSKRRGGLLERDSKEQWKIRTRRRQLIKSWLLVPDADYTDQSIAARPYDGIYTAESPLGQKFFFTDLSLEARNEVKALDNQHVAPEALPFSTKNASELNIEIRNVVNESQYTLDFMVRLGKELFTTGSRRAQYTCTLAPDGTYLAPFSSIENLLEVIWPNVLGNQVGASTPVLSNNFFTIRTTLSYFELDSTIGRFRARKGIPLQTVYADDDPSGIQQEPWELDFGNGFAAYSGIIDGTLYHIEFSCAIESGNLIKRVYFHGNLVAQSTGAVITDKLDISVNAYNYKLVPFTLPTPITVQTTCPTIYEVREPSFGLGFSGRVIGYAGVPPFATYQESEVLVSRPSEEGLCAVSGIRFTPGTALHTENSFTPPTSITTFA